MKTKMNLKKISFILLVFSTTLSWSQETLSLSQVLEKAKANNKSLQISENEIAIATEKNKEVKSNLIPKIQAVGDYKYFFDLPTQLMPAKAFNPMAPDWQFNPAQFGVPHNINASVQVMVPVYNPQLYGNIKTTKIAKELRQLKYKKSKEQIFYGLSNLYYNAQVIKSQNKFIKGNIANTEKLLKNLKLLYQYDMIKQSDVDKIDLQLQQLKTMENKANASLEQVLNAIKFYMGEPLDAKIDVEETINTSDNNYMYAKESTLDFKMAKTKTALIKSEISTLKRSRLPSLSLIGSYGTTGYGYDETPDHEFLDFYDVSFVGAKLSIPIFNGTTTTRKIKQKQFELTNSEIQQEIVADKKAMEIKSATLNKAISKQNIKNLQDQVNLAQKIYDQTIVEQKEGTASLSDVIMADNTLRQAQQDFLQAEIDYLKADLELKKITGNIK
jgi:OMF family outer membrane factor